MAKNNIGSSPAASGGPSSNWAALKKTIPTPSPRSSPSKTTSKALDKGKGRASDTSTYTGPSSKYMSGGVSGIAKFLPNGKKGFLKSVESLHGPGSSSSVVQVTPTKREEVRFFPPPNDDPLVIELREMVAGRLPLSEGKKAIALDCEMVGLGYKGSESALARISIVNYYGHVLLDTFVQPREMVTDWRTWVSGIREKDLVGAPSFEIVQKQVAELVEGKVVVGHAIDNDLKILLLSHPGPMVRDTQKCKQLRDKAKTRHPGLKKLSEMELGLGIQKGAHSSVIDARATMALYRLHKTAWEQSLRPQTEAFRQKMGLPSLWKQKDKQPITSSSSSSSKANGLKRNREEDSDEEDGDKDNEGNGGKSAERSNKKLKGGRIKGGESFPGGGKKGVSSGLSVVIKRTGGEGLKGGNPKRGRVVSNNSGGGKWWEEGAT